MAFEAFLTQDKVKPKGRRITYIASLGLHGVALIYAIVYSFWHVGELSPPSVSVTFMSAPPPPPPPPPPPKKKSSTKTKPKVEPIVQPKPNQVVQPKEEPPPEEEEEDSGEDDGVEGGVEGGVKGGVVGGVIGGVVGGVGTDTGPPAMLPPAIGEKQILSRPEPVIPEVVKRSGMLLFNLVKTCVGKGGDVTSGVVIKPSDPLYDKAVVESWQKTKFRPMSVGGNPVPFCFVSRNVLKVVN